MTVSIVAKDFCFPAKVPAAERPPVWDEFVRDHLGRKVVYPVDSAWSRRESEIATCFSQSRFL